MKDIPHPKKNPDALKTMPAEDQAIASPDWDAAGKVHDWRNHVDDNVRAIWETFSPTQRAALHAQADRLASAEHWD